MITTVEERLKELILTKYHSIREFTIATDIPYSTFYTMLERGLLNSNINNIVKVCASLNISADALADGKIVFNENTNEEKEDDIPEKTLDIRDILENTKRQLLAYDGLMFNGQPADKESIDSILGAMEIGIEMAKRNRK